MNGAAPVPERKIKTPKTNSTRRIGSSHHFLLWHRNSQNSPSSVGGDPLAAAF
jgi:hypothetical protein